MTPLHRQLLDVLVGLTADNLFEPGVSEAALQSHRGQALVEALEGATAQEIAIASLRALSAQRDAVEAEKLELELVATMPGYRSAVAQDTGSAVLKLVQGAERQLIVVGYELTNKEFESEIHLASERGVDIVMITDRRSKHGPRVLKEWPEHLSLPRVYQERESDVSHMAKMHGKALLADGSSLFISSANFTWLAVNANIELGVVLRGAPVASARDLFEELLVESRLLERVRAASGRRDSDGFPLSPPSTRPQPAPEMLSQAVPTLFSLSRADILRVLELLVASTRGPLRAKTRLELDALIGRGSIELDAARIVPAVKLCLSNLDAEIARRRLPWLPTTQGEELDTTLTPRVTAPTSRAAAPPHRVEISSIGDFQPEGPLKLVGYQVGANSQGKHARRQCLESLVCNFSIPRSSYDRAYVEGWGTPGSSTRKRRTEVALQKLISINGSKTGMAVAVSEWRSDLFWLQRARLVRGVLRKSER